MQLILDIKQEQDIKLLLPLLERLKISYKQIPSESIGKARPASDSKLSERYAGKLPADIGEAFQKHIAESRNEWERNI